MYSLIRKLNPLLRLASISGVETAIELHILRGDDLNARDGSGATPLILAAAKRRKGAVRLLLDAGANPKLADLNGMDALAHAVKGGCPETIALLTEALARAAAPELPEEQSSDSARSGGYKDEVVSLDEPTVLLPSTVEPPSTETPSASVDTSPAETASEDCGEPETELIEEISSDPESPVDAAFHEVALKMDSEVVSFDEEPLEDLFADDWEAEGDVSPPKGDETVVEAVRQVHETIGRHKVVDRDEDWGDVDLHLPFRAAPLAHDKGTGAVSDLLLAALREGMVSEDDLIEVCSNADGSRNEESERLLAAIAGELGATVVEWTGSEEPFRAEPTLEEERLLTEAAEFAEDLASGRNDPFRFYAKDIRGDLLEIEEEIALGREMEEAGCSALSALAAWPDGLSALFDAAARVAAGEADAESFCAGPEPSSDEEPGSRSVGARDDGDEDEDGDESERDEEASFFVNAVAAVQAARGDVHRAIKALEQARLTRGFLMELAEKAGRSEAGRNFVDALGRQAAARERLILCNLRLALSIAKKHLWSGIPLDDLVQEANIGLMKAVERYDWRRGLRFSTYATWWIRQRVYRSIADTGRVVRVPVHIQNKARKILREREEAEVRLGRPERESETARRAGMSLAKTRVLLSVFDDILSLDEIDSETGLSRVEGLPDVNALGPADVAERSSLRTTLLGMLDDLDKQSRMVILLRFGLTGKDPMSLEEVGQLFGVTRERIRQIESMTMRRLSHRDKRDILWPFMGDGYAPNSVSSVQKARPVMEEDSPSDKVAPVSQVSPIDRLAPSFPSPRSSQEAGAFERLLPVRAAPEVHPGNAASTTPTSLLPGDQVSRIADEARALGLEVNDCRSEGGELRIVAPFDSPLNVRTFSSRLLASGFRKVQRDVFAK